MEGSNQKLIGQNISQRDILAVIVTGVSKNVDLGKLFGEDFRMEVCNAAVKIETILDYASISIKIFLLIFFCL
jgi:hypothetical protein